MPRLSIRANFIWTLVGNIVYAGAQWGILVVLAKLGSPKLVGQFALGMAMTAPVMMLTNLHLRAIQVTDIREEYQFGDYLGLRLITSFIGFGIIVSIVVLGGYLGGAGLLILAIAAAKVIESISDVAYGLLQKRERMDRIAISMMLKGIVSCLIFSLVVWLTDSVILGTVGLAIVWLTILVSFDLRNARQISDVRPQFDFVVLWRMTKLAIPLGIVMMLVSLNSNIPRYFIELIKGEQALGYFAAIAYMALVGQMLVGALGEAASARLAIAYKTGKVMDFEKLLLVLVTIGLVIGGSAWLIASRYGREILSLLYQPDYADYVDIFVWLMLVAGINYVGSFLGYGMTAARYFRVQVPLFATVALVLIVACMTLIPAKGILGAVQAMGIAASVQLLGGIIINSYAVWIKRKRYLAKVHEG